MNIKYHTSVLEDFVLNTQKEGKSMEDYIKEAGWTWQFFGYHEDIIMLINPTTNGIVLNNNKNAPKVSKNYLLAFTYYRILTNNHTQIQRGFETTNDVNDLETADLFAQRMVDKKDIPENRLKLLNTIAQNPLNMISKLDGEFTWKDKYFSKLSEITINHLWKTGLIEKELKNRFKDHVTVGDWRNPSEESAKKIIDKNGKYELWDIKELKEYFESISDLEMLFFDYMVNPETGEWMKGVKYE